MTARTDGGMRRESARGTACRPPVPRGARSRIAVLLSLLSLSAATACGTAPPTTGRVEVAPPGSPAVELTYLGVGGWIMEWRGESVLAAPLFSNPSLVRTSLAPIRSDTVAVDRSMGRYDVSGAGAILVGHGHYDHLMDVPRVARRHAPHAAILGSWTVRNLLGSWSGVGARVLEVDSLAGSQDEPGTWIPVGDAFRILPLESHHAPHFEGRTLYSGTADVLRVEEPDAADEWVDGPTYAYLVDFLRPDGSVALRLYYQDAVAAPPLGFAPEALMEERPVDVAILVPATFDQVDWHPEAFVANLRPRWVLLGHWEDFFRPPDEPAEPVPLTDLDHFEARLDRVLAGEFWRPVPHTSFRFPVEG